MGTPKKWWWIPGVAVPILVALIAAIAVITSSGGGYAGGNTHNNVSGDQYQGDVAYNTFNVIALEMEQMSAAAVPTRTLTQLRQALEALEAEQFEAGIPLLEAVNRTISTPTLRRSLDAARLAARTAQAVREPLDSGLSRPESAVQQAAELLGTNQGISGARPTLSTCRVRIPS